MVLDRATDGEPSAADWEQLRASGATVVFVESPNHALAIHAAAVRDGVTPSGFLDTGSELVSDNPVDGVESRRVEFGIRTCWGS